MAQYEVTAQHPNKDAQQTVEDKTRKFRKNKKTERQTWRPAQTKRGNTRRTVSTQKSELKTEGAGTLPPEAAWGPHGTLGSWKREVGGSVSTSRSRGNHCWIRNNANFKKNKEKVLTPI